MKGYLYILLCAYGSFYTHINPQAPAIYSGQRGLVLFYSYNPSVKTDDKGYYLLD